MAPNANEVEQAVARTLRDSLAKLQQTTRELDQAVSDLVSACASARPLNSLPSMLRARSAAASLAASLEVLSQFVVTALQTVSPAERDLLATLPRAIEPLTPAEAVELTEVEKPAASAETVAAEPLVAESLVAEPLVAEPLVAEPLVAESPLSEPPVVESPTAESLRSETAHVEESEPLEAAAHVEEQSERPVTTPPLIDAERVGIPSRDVENTEPAAPVLSIEEAISVAPKAPAEFAVSKDSASAEAPSLELPTEPPSVEPVFEATAFEQPAAEPTKVESAVSEAAVSENGDNSAQIAELYELAAWKDPNSKSEAQESAPEASGAEVSESETVPQSAPAIQDAESLPVEVSASSDTLAPLAASTLSEELPPEAKGFDVAALSADEQELHRRANRVAKVSMQDVKMLRPRDVALGKENRDICLRLRDDIEKAHKEYDRRFHTILDHPVDYFYDWMVEILGDGDPEALGEYPYPSTVVRH